MLGPSFRRPLALALVAGVVGVAVVASQLIGHLYERSTERAAAESLRASQAMFRALERGDVRKLDAALGALMEDHELRQLFKARGREALLAAARPRFEDLKVRDAISHWYFIEPDRRVFLRVHRPGLFGDQVDRLTLTKAVESRNMGAGLELGQTAFALRVVRPWMVDGALLGYLELAEDLGQLLARLKQETGNEFGVLVKKQFLDEAAWARITGAARNTWSARPDVVVMDTTSFSDGLVDFQGDVATLPDDGTILDEEVRGDRAWLRGLFPIVDAAGRKVGALAVLHDVSALHQVMVAGRRQVLLVVLGMSLLASLLAWAALERWVLRPLGAAVAAAEREGGVAPAPGADELTRLRDLLARPRGGRPG